MSGRGGVHPVKLVAKGGRWKGERLAEISMMQRRRRGFDDALNFKKAEAQREMLARCQPSDLRPLERWPGYTEQSWAERFAELDRQHNALLERISPRWPMERDDGKT